MELTKKINESGKLKGFLFFLGLTSFSILFVCLPYFFRGKHFLWYFDGTLQHLPLLIHYKEVGWFKLIGGIDYYAGLGADYMGTWTFLSLFDPLNIVFFICPFNYLISYDVLVVIKLLACATTMYVFLRAKHNSKSNSIIFSIIYMVSGFIFLTALRHHNLSSCPIYFPLLILGIDRCFEGKRPYLLIASSFLCFITNFYMFFFEGVICALYSLLYYFTTEQDKTIKKFIIKIGYIALCFILSLIIAGVVLLPNLLSYFNSARSSSKGLGNFSFITLFYDMATVIIPVAALSRYSVMLTSMPTLILTIYCFITKNKKYLRYKIITAILFVGYFIPLFGFLMNLCNYSNNRWSFMLNFFIIVLISSQSNEKKQIEPNNIKKTNNIFISYLIIMIAVFLCGVCLEKEYSVVFEKIKYLVAILIAIACTISIYFLFKRTKFINKIAKIYKPIVLINFAFISSLVNALLFTTFYSSKGTNAALYSSLYSSEEKYISQENKNSFYRADVIQSQGIFGTYANNCIINNYKGTRLYNSVSSRYVYAFLKENNVFNPLQTLGTVGLDGRYPLYSLLSVNFRYDIDNVVTDENLTLVNGYDNLYENNNSVSFGIFFDKTISREDYNSLDPIAKQYALCEGLLLENVNSTINTDYYNDIVVTNTIEENFKIVKGKKITFNLENVKDKDLYINFGNNDVVTQETTLVLNCNGQRREYDYYPKGRNKFSNENEFSVYCGTCKEDNCNLEIILDNGTSLTIKSLTYSLIDKEHAANTATVLSSKEHLENVSFSPKKIRGEINCASDGYLFLSIPYSKGFSATVDGVSQKIVRADSAFLAVKVSAGHHKIIINYSTPLLKEGLITSATGIGIFICSAIFFEIKKEKKLNNVFHLLVNYLKR